MEFLDFECEGCGAAYPAVEQLRQTYGDQVTFVVRYFPLPGHFNADRAARAVAAAAEQGQFEPMYRKMFDTQRSWGEQRVPLDDLFFSYAQELGLDRIDSPPTTTRRPPANSSTAMSLTAKRWVSPVHQPSSSTMN